MSDNSCITITVSIIALSIAACIITMNVRWYKQRNDMIKSGYVQTVVQGTTYTNTIWVKK